jgi:hypothetical protein
MGVFLLLGACAHQEEDNVEALQEAVEGYNRAFRWKAYERASNWLPSDVRASFVATYLDNDAKIHVEDYRVLKVAFKSKDAATVTVRIQVMVLPSATLETRMLVQHWHKVQDSWIMETEEHSLLDIDTELVPAEESFGGGDSPPTNDEAKEADKNQEIFDKKPATDP